MYGRKSMITYVAYMPWVVTMLATVSPLVLSEQNSPWVQCIACRGADTWRPLKVVWQLFTPTKHAFGNDLYASDAVREGCTHGVVAVECLETIVAHLDVVVEHFRVVTIGAFKVGTDEWKTLVGVFTKW